MPTKRHEHRRRAEAARIEHLRPLREPPFRDRDRDRGLELAWRRRLRRCQLIGPAGVLRLGHADDYGIGDETGTWRVWSNVGRASLMLRPADGGDEYGYLITREPHQQVGLNDEPYEVRPDS